MYFPWDRNNWIKEELSTDGKDFIIPWNLLKPVPIKQKERYEKPAYKQVNVSKPARRVLPAKVANRFCHDASNAGIKFSC